MNKHFLIASLLLLTSVVHSVTDTPKVIAPVTQKMATPTEAVAALPAYKSYDYVGDRFRDPFLPLLGDARSQDENADIPPSIASLQLKGIVQDSKGRVAILVSGASSYVMRGGRLYDGRNRMVKKISGVVKADSVVVIGSDRTVRELRTTPKF